MKYKDKGGIQITEADDANVPVNCLLCEPDGESPKWRWFADNFTPRKSSVYEGAYILEADTKEELLAVVRERVVPLYEAALHNLKTNGHCYYWEIESP